MDEYKAVYFCKACGKQLSYDERVCHQGVCKYCGAKSIGQVVDCTKSSVKITDSIIPGIIGIFIVIGILFLAVRGVIALFGL
jgi:predicted RNA-binding Zn-ribbon protein involved in translation (DUF1610 family)